MKYILHKFYENGECEKIIGIREGLDLYDFISRKWDKVIEGNIGFIEITGHVGFLKDYIMVDDDCD